MMKDRPASDGGLSAYLAPGTHVGDYRIESFIDRGGMAFVYEATDLRLGRHVALKVLAPELAADPDFQKRFLRESRFAASLDHPNIVPIYEAGQAGELLYIAMRFVPGDDLAALLGKEHHLEPQRALGLLSGVASALDTAHAAGLVHRDVKPGNILVVPADRDICEHVYLSDFGLTKRSSSMTRITASGMFTGTMTYIAPEQIQGQPLDARTDLYALGCATYECLTGVAPFVRDDQAALLWAHLSDTPAPLSTHRRELAPADHVLAKALAKAPADRYQSGHEFITALSEALTPSQQGHVHPAPGRLRPLAPAPTRPPTPAPPTIIRLPAAPAPVSVPAAPATQVRARAQETPTTEGAGAAAAVTVMGRAVPQTAPPPRPPGSHRQGRPRARRPSWYLPALAGAIIAALAASWFVVGPGGDRPAAVFLPFALETYDNGVEVSRSWLLSEEGDRLHGEVIMLGGSPGATFDEVIPKSLAATAGQVRADPAPVEIVRDDPVLRFQAPSGPDGQITLSYDIEVTPEEPTRRRLDSWAADHKRERDAYLASVQEPQPDTLATLALLPDSLSVTVSQQPHQLSLVGTNTDGQPTDPAELGKALWTSTDPSVASVTNTGVVTALAPGAVNIIAQLGPVQAEAVILVTDPTTSSASPSHALPDGRIVRPAPGGGPAIQGRATVCPDGLAPPCAPAAQPQPEASAVPSPSPTCPQPGVAPARFANASMQLRFAAVAPSSSPPPPSSSSPPPPPSSSPPSSSPPPPSSSSPPPPPTSSPPPTSTTDPTTGPPSSSPPPTSPSSSSPPPPSSTSSSPPPPTSSSPPPPTC